MKSFLFFFLFFTGCFVPKSSRSFLTLSGKVTFSQEYCGGAAPSEELLQAIRKPKPYVNFKIYVREGVENSLHARIIDSVLTDKDGRFSFTLPPGKYVLLSEYHKDRKIFKPLPNRRISDKKCLEEWWRSGLASLDLQMSVDTLHFHIHKRCFLPEGVPCLFYTGPMPP